MPLDIPDRPSEVERIVKTDFARTATGSNPFLANSWILGLISGFSNRLFDNYLTVSQAVNAAFYDTSPEKFLLRQTSWYNFTRLQPSQSVGNIIVTGTNGTSVPLGTQFATQSGLIVVSTSAVSISQTILTADSVTSIGTTATATFTSKHNLSQGVSVVSAGANEPQYNKTFNPTIIDDLTIQYELDSVSASPATGTITFTFLSALIPCQSQQFSSEVNLSPGHSLTLSGGITGIDTAAFVDADGFAGGADLESIENFRERFLEIIRNPVANFNVSAIKQKAREIAGVTRVFVQEITPNIGQVTIYFTRDNDNVIPTNADALLVKNKILEIKPANTSSNDVIVNPLVPVSTDFTFSSVIPNTDTMKQAVENSLDEFFKTIPEPETIILRDQYITAIYNTVDTKTGERIESFVLDSPTVNIDASATGRIATLGTVTT